MPNLGRRHTRMPAVPNVAKRCALDMQLLAFVPATTFTSILPVPHSSTHLIVDKLNQTTLAKPCSSPQCMTNYMFRKVNEFCEPLAFDWDD